MQRKVRPAGRLTGGIDPWLMLAFLGLMCAGVLMVYSASIADAYTYYGSAMYIFQREVVWVVLGFIALAVAVRLDYRIWQRVSIPLLAISMLLLVAVLAPHIGHASHGARRWFAVSSFIQLEPSELVKLALVVHLAAWLSLKGERIRDFNATFVPFSIIVGIVALLIVKQPDLGTTIVVTVTTFAIIFIAGANLGHLAAVSAGATCVAAMLAQSSTYRFGRLTAFMNPWKDPAGVGYHTIQALLALGSGGMFGRGLGNSAQKFVLPAPHTDSILAVIGEEWGLAGTVTLLLLYVVIAYRGIHITIGAPDAFSRLLAAGITTWITFQALMNFAVITSSVPFTGVPLPFVSYGGTSLIITMTAMGILLNISRHVSKESLAHFNSDHGRGDRGARVPRAFDHREPEPARTRRPQIRPRKPADAAIPRRRISNPGIR